MRNCRREENDGELYKYKKREYRGLCDRKEKEKKKDGKRGNKKYEG